MWALKSMTKDAMVVKNQVDATHLRDVIYSKLELDSFFADALLFRITNGKGFFVEYPARKFKLCLLYYCSVIRARVVSTTY